MQKSKAKDSYDVSIKNVGGFVFPFDIKVTYADGITGISHQTPIVWKKDQKQINVFVKIKKAIKSAVPECWILWMPTKTIISGSLNKAHRIVNLRGV